MSKQSKARFFVSDNDARKAGNFIKLWNDPTVRTILSFRGGYGTFRLIEHLDRAHLQKRKPTHLWGFSDLTTVQNWLYFRTGQAWVHSPMVISNALREPSPIEARTWERYLNAQPGETITHRLKLSQVPPPEWKGDHSRRLPLLGGNMMCFFCLLGTKWEPRIERPYLLFLEEINESAYRLDRLLTQFRGSRWFRNCRGLVLGHFTKCPGALALLRNFAKENGLICVEGLQAGHDRPNLPITMGTACSLTLKKDPKKGRIAELTMPIVPFG